MWRVRHCIVPLAIAALSCACAAQIGPTIDLGWLRATQSPNGWLVSRAFHQSYTGQVIEAGDIIVAVDGRSLANLNALSAAWVLNQVPYFSRSADVIRAEKPQHLNFFPAGEPLLQSSSKFIDDTADFELYPSSARAPLLALPDITNQIQTITYGPHYTLIHIWEPHCAVCWKDIPALNEISHPAMDSLRVIPVVINGTAEQVSAVSKRRPIQFANLFAGERANRQFEKTFDVTVTPADMLVDPEGNVIFVGAGVGSLRSALEIFKTQAALTSSAARSQVR